MDNALEWRTHMKKNSRKKYAAVLVAVCAFAVFVPHTSRADVTQKKIDDTKDKITDLQQQKKEAEQQVDRLNEHKETLESDLDGLNSRLDGIISSMNSVEAQISAKEQELTVAGEQLAEAEKQAAGQYSDMKVRIQYMYENGSAGIWEMLLESGSFTEFLNRAEYAAEVQRYDREKLEQYQELQSRITEQKRNLEKERQELVALGEQMEEKKTSVNALIAETRDKIARSDADIADAEADAESLEAEIEKMKAYERELEIKKAREDAERMAKIKEQEKEDRSAVVYNPSDSDAYLLGAIIECEAGGEPYEGKMAVGSVIMNRVKSAYFPNTVSGVIYQNGQFSPVASGRLAYRLQAGVSSSCMEAAQKVLDGNLTTDSLYFRMNNGIISGTVIGNHVFY